MHSDKKLTKEDTWGPADLKKYIREEVRGDARRRDDIERKHHRGESIEKRHRDPEKEYRREKDNIRERRDEHEKSRHAERRKEGSRDRRSDKERERREERDKETRKERDRVEDGDKYGIDHRENRERRRDRKEWHDRERDKERSRDKEKERVKEREKYYEDEKDRRRQERDKERSRDKEKDRVRERDKYSEEKDRRREERDKERVRERDKYYEEDKDRRRDERDKERRRQDRDREHRSERERRRHEERRDGEKERTDKYDTEQRDRHRDRERHKDHYEVKRSEKERRERHADRSERKEDRDYREEQRKDKEERERRHKHRGDYDEKRKPDSKEHRGDEVLDHRSDRDRRERDRHNDRRHQEETNTERHHADSTSLKKPEPDTSDTRRTTAETTDVSEPQAPTLKDAGDTETPSLKDIVNDEDVAEPEYEDDFEDYEEDFEDMDESANEGEEEKESEEEEMDELSAKRREEVKAIQRAMDEENERLRSIQSKQSPVREEEDRPKWTRESEKSKNSQRGKFINFVAAKQREVSKKVATKQKKRSTELLRLIDLDFSVTSSLLDLPPVSEYDMYIRNFGTANTKQAYVQCNEDNADRDIQTEEIEFCEKWTQHPPEHNGACGDPNLSQDAQDRAISEINFDSKRLASFLQTVSQVMVVLLEEDQAERKSLRKLNNQTDALSFSDGSLQLNTKLPFLYGRCISLIQFSQVQKHTMMSVHNPITKPSAVRLDSYTIICIWNIWEPSKPQKILVYESEVQCCCFSPGKAILVFAGTSVGSVVLWDLREQAKNHYRLAIGEDEWILRQPTFSTDAVMAGSGHFSSVTSVEVVPSTVAGGLRPEVPLLASEDESSGLSFQLASLDETGVLNFWVVVELPKSNEAGSQIDLGLRPGGKVKLLHSSSLLAAERVSQQEAAKSGPLQTLHLKFLPMDSNHFFIGTNMGTVSHGTTHGLKAPPKLYGFQEGGVRPVDVIAINFSPFRPHLFLVGCGDGSIRLHTVSHEQPLAEWNNATAGEPVISLQWTQTRPAVFCVLDTASNLHLWDLLKNETQPVITERMNADRVTAMAAFGDSGQQNTYSGLALAHESGKIEMQYFTKNLTSPSPAEEDKLKYLMNEAF